MDETLPSRLLEAQHREIDRGAQDILQGAQDPQLLHKMAELLRLHIYVEEEIVFPAITTSALEMPLYIMKHEHGQIWNIMEHMIEAASGATIIDTAVREDCRKLLVLFQRHNPKEEDLIYAAGDRVATEDPQGTLVAAIEAARRPEGWLCMAKREDFAPPPGAPAWQPAPLPR